MKKSLFALTLMLTVLAACGPAPAATTVPVQPTTVSAEPSPTPEQADGSVNPSGEQVTGGVISPSDIPQGTFRAEVTGAVSGVFEGPAVADSQAGGILLTFAQAGTSHTVTIVFPVETAPAEYVMRSYLDAFDQQGIISTVSGGYTQITTASDNPVIYQTVTEGTLALQSVTPYTGTFEFTADDGSGSIVNVRGAFNAIALLGA